jgi:CheY-like chemotaxis protein
MSHEIRTPMNTIIGFTKVMLKTELSDKQKEYLNAIELSGDALIVLINDILDLAKVEAGKMTFEQVPFKLSSTISSMMHLFEPKLQEKNIKLIKEYDKKIPEVLLGDYIRLNQIMLNLLSNAVKFTSVGKITVGVHLVEEDNKKVKVEFQIKDTGIGIKKDKIATIFESFQQATNDTTRLFGGTGLGLSIVKQLLEPQGGHISVESEYNEGSTFTFTLTFLKTKAKVESLPDTLQLNLEMKEVKVLVVEDMALNQLLMRTILDDFGLECDIAENGKIALEKLHNNPYDIILMDLQMPEMNGFEATDYIRNTMKLTIPIIALTADVTTVDVEKCRQAGMNDYIAKPIDEKILYSKIVTLLKNPVITSTHESVKRDTIERIKCINLSYLENRTKSNPKLMKEMISIYLEQTPSLVQSMKTGFHTQDWKLLSSAVHKMIPSFSIMGIHKDFEEMAHKVQAFPKNQLLSKEIEDMVLQLENICKQACEELEDELRILG